MGREHTNWTFEDTLSQIGLGYVFLFLLGFYSQRVQWTAFVLILVGYWGAWAAYPLPGADFDNAAVGVPADWAHHATGFAAHWNKNANLGNAFDQWFLNLFPREEPFVANGGGYLTLSFIPTLATMILGLIAGGWLKSGRPPIRIVMWMLIAGVLGIAIGMALHSLGVCPNVKRIWTPTWTIFSGGWCFLILAAFYAVLDWGGWKQWAFPLIVIGMNSIAAYCMAHLFESFIESNFETHFGAEFFSLLGTQYEPLVRGAVVLAAYWLFLLWMYRRKLFLKI
jgi:predicted acyltransferase